MGATQEYDKLLDALRAMPKGAEGMSSREIAVALGCCVESARNKIMAACEAGVLEFAGKRTETGTIGQVRKTPVYRLRGKR